MNILEYGTKGRVKVRGESAVTFVKGKIKLNLRKKDQKLFKFFPQLDTAVVNMNESKDRQNLDMKQFKDELENVMERVEEINEKMYDFEANKRNNLIFYGIPNEHKEVQPALLQKITHIIKTTLGIRRDIPVAKVLI